MQEAHKLLGGAVLCMCAIAPAAAEEVPACPTPQATAWADAQGPIARKFSLSLAGCSAGPSAGPAAAAHVARQLDLYDRPSAMLPALPAPQPARLAPSAAPAVASVAARRADPSRQRALALSPQVQRVAQAYDIDPLLLHAIAHVESRHNPQAVSHAGGLGLMQVMPATARRFGVGDPRSELLDPATSLEVGSAYLKTLQARFGNNLALVLAAYNAGEGAVEKHGRTVPPYRETRGYVQDVLAQYRALRAAMAALQ